MRKSIIVAGLIAIVGVVGGVALIDSATRTSIEAIGSDITGSTVSVAEFDSSLFGGRAEISGFRLANPTSFGPGDAFRTEHIALDVDLASVFDDRLVIEEIVIDSPEIIYALTAKGSNLGHILDTVTQSAEDSGAAAPAADTKTDADSTGGASIMVSNFYLRNATVRVSFPGLVETAPSVVIPEIHLQNLSGDTVQEVVAEASDAVMGAIETVVSEIDNEAVRQHVQALTDTTADAAVKLIEGAAKILEKGLKTIFETKPTDAD
jgi:hypothetical protein